MAERFVRILDAGIQPHPLMAAHMVELQQARVADEIGDTLLLVEHPEVVTVGPTARRDGVQVPTDYATTEIDRGGGITWHGPGQLTVYPILRWDLAGEANVKAITYKLESWAIAALADCGIEAGRDPRMQGIWVDGHKVGSVGLAFSRWVSRHGFTINFATSPGRVDGLAGCGLPEGVTTCLHRLGHDRDLEGRIIDRRRLIEALLETFGVLDRVAMHPEPWTP